MKSFGLQWHITNQCDQRCKHCYIYNKNNVDRNYELSLYTLSKILNDFLQFCSDTDCSPSIAITGGDPILHPDFWTFLKLLKKYNLNFSILGNPFHLSIDVIKSLKDLGCNNYQMSLDGTRDIHDYIRKPGSFDETLRMIDLLNAEGLYSSIMTTVSRININVIPELVKSVVDHNVRNFAFARYCPDINDIGNMVSPSDYKDLLIRLWETFEFYKEYNTQFSLKDHLWTLFLYEKGLFTIDNDEEIIFDGCHCSISHMTVLADGTVYACRRFDSPVGKVPDNTFMEIFHSDQMEQFRNFNKFEACSDCELLRFCRGCPAVAFCSTGNFYAKDPQCWKNQ